MTPQPNQAPSPGSQAASAADPSPDTPEVPAGAQEPNTERDLDQVTDVSALRSEAASRRRALREVEAERDQLKGRIDQHDRQTIERIATDRLADPADAWLVIGSLDELRGDDGVLDEAKVEEGLARIVQDRPHWRLGSGADADTHPGARQPAETETGPSFGQSIKRAFGGG